MNVDHISLLTTPVKLFRGADLVSQGTGFYYVRKIEEGDIVFLVTNQHVLTGWAPLEKKPPIGDQITFQFHQSDEETGKVTTVTLPLFTKSGKQVWVGSVMFPEADLAVILVNGQLCHGCTVRGIASHWADPKMKVRPTTTVTLIGYPYGFYDAKNALPIWKTGSVASEPEIDFEGKPLMLIDVAAFPGMSGSPAFATAYGMYEMHNGTGVTAGAVQQFIGIYASNVVRHKERFLEYIPHAASLGIRDDESLQIGHIWKAKLILGTVEAIEPNRYITEILQDLPPIPQPTPT
ncbi:MAG: serine protease [Thermoguttaceae bacterium]